MRTRTAKTLAQRIDLTYFKRPHGMRRLRLLLSIAVPALGLVWLGGMALAGSRAPYSSGPVSSAHAFAEQKCEVCHQRDGSFRSHVTDRACLTCHAGPGHPALPPPVAGEAHYSVEVPCATCHREHGGRVRLATTVSDSACVECHDEQSSEHPAYWPPPPQPPHVPAPTRPGPWAEVRSVRAFPSAHPEVGVIRENFKDPGGVGFNHQLHLKEDLRGPNGPEKLECTTCHRPQLAPTRGAAKRVGNLMTSVTFDQQCARCHPLFFDGRVDRPAPHGNQKAAWTFVDTALREYITANPAAIAQQDVPDRRMPLNFPRDPEPIARSAEEWVERRGARARAYLTRACSYCHGDAQHVDAPDGTVLVWPAVNLRTQWMSRATFDHAPHLMVECSSCHKASESRATADVLMPSVQTCATCHAPGKGASSQCIECHGYHDWSKAQPVKPHFKLTDFQ